MYTIHSLTKYTEGLKLNADCGNWLYLIVRIWCINNHYDDRCGGSGDGGDEIRVYDTSDHSVDVSSS